MEKRKVNVYIDWFNLYHAVEKLWDKYKWINLRKLSENYIDTKTQEIKSVYFFSAYPEWNKEKTKRHKNYVKALMSERVTIRNWKFNQVSRKFRKRSNNIINVILWSTILEYLRKTLWDKVIPKEIEYSTHEEKRTDVNIVLQIFEDAVKEKYDDAIIISWDSDIIPVITSVNNTIKWKKFISVLPYRSKWKDIKKACDSFQSMTKDHLEDSFFSDEVKFNWYIIKSPYI